MAKLKVPPVVILSHHLIIWQIIEVSQWKRYEVKRKRLLRKEERRFYEQTSEEWKSIIAYRPSLELERNRKQKHWKLFELLWNVNYQFWSLLSPSRFSRLELRHGIRMAKSCTISAHKRLRRSIHVYTLTVSAGENTLHLEEQGFFSQNSTL